MRASRTNAKVSAWAHLNGTYDFNRTPLAPPGIRILIHEKSDKRTSWSPHALDGWYIGPATESYRCYKVWVWETRATRICDTISWFPTKITMPLASPTDLILAGVQDIVQALNDPAPATVFKNLNDSHVEALRQLTSLLTGITPSGNAAVKEPLTPAKSLRVVSTLDPLPSGNNAPATPALTTPLRVVPQPSATVHVHAAPLKAASPDPNAVDTYDNTTGPTGKKRRKRRKKKVISAKAPKKVRFQQGTRNGRTTKKISPRTVSQSKTQYPLPPSRPLPTHNYPTRANSKRTRAAHTKSASHQAAAALSQTTSHSAFNLFSDVSTPIAELADFTEHFALHGNAFNPDTGKIAEYAELRN